MSQCYICGAPIAEPRIDPRDKKLRPCATCEAVIADTVAEFNEDGHNYIYDYSYASDGEIYDVFEPISKKETD